jgi:hypothetical protein
MNETNPFGPGLLLGAFLILAAVAGTFILILWCAGQSITAFPKGVTARDLGVIALIAGSAIGVAKVLAALELAPVALVPTIATEAFVLVGTGGVAWLFTRE